MKTIWFSIVYKKREQSISGEMNWTAVPHPNHARSTLENGSHA